MRTDILQNDFDAQRLAVLSFLKQRSDANDLEDITQCALLKAWKNRGQFRGQAKFSTWLMRIAWNELLMARRGYHPEFVTMPESLGSHPDVDIERIQRSENLHRKITRLSEKDRKIMFLCGLRELNYVEASRVLKVNSSALKHRYYRAKIALRRMIEADKKESL